MPQPNYQTAADVMHVWENDVLSGVQPVFYPIGDGELSLIEIGPGLVTLLGGAPGAGKTAFTMQAVVDALRLTPTLRAVICNIEMPPSVLLDRQLARLSGIDLTTIRYRRLSEAHAARIEVGMETLSAVSDRMAFVRSPFDLSNVAAVADEFDAGMIVLDYIQRIPPPGDHGDKRHSVDATMNHLRAFADAGVAVIVLSAVGRSRDSRGASSYEGLGLASFRESSELEFGCDDAFILSTDRSTDAVVLKHLKSRNGSCRDIELAFDRPLQRFTPRNLDIRFDRPDPGGDFQAALAQAWADASIAEPSNGGRDE